MNCSIQDKIKMSDENLVSLVKNSDDDAFDCLYKRYLPKIRTMTYSFQGLGFDLDDLIQEATIGFYTAIQAYDFKSASFSTFCYLCMRRMLISLIKQNFKKSAVPKNSVIYTDNAYFDFPDSNNPEQDYIAKEEFYNLTRKISTDLSEKEHRILFEFLNGMDYNSIAEKLNVSRKTVDNALQRVRKKLR